MDSTFGIIIIIIVFILVLTAIYYLLRNNMFSAKSENKSSKLTKDSQFENKLEELKIQNRNLEKEIKFLEDKNRRLRIKIEQMKMVIENLQDQKNKLEASEKNLKKLRVQKDEALAMVAHDIKNPASTIKNFVELLESYDLSAQDQQDVLEGLIETSSRLVRLANEFTQVITEEYVPFELEKVDSDLNEVIESIVKVNRIKAAEKGIEVRLYQPENEITINIDKEKIKEVVDNFVGNAIKYCPEKSIVEVFTKKEQKEVTVEIADNGFGLTEDEIAHVFEKGSKMSNKPTGNETSSGLGLWIAKKIVEEHHGKVFVKSKKGFGATFSFTLPLN